MNMEDLEFCDLFFSFFLLRFFSISLGRMMTRCIGQRIITGKQQTLGNWQWAMGH